MLRKLILLISVVMMTACASGRPDSNQAILDFSRPPTNLHPARLVRLNGQNVNAPITRTSFWVDPGTHEIVVAAGINDPMQVGRNPAGRTGPDPGLVTIEVEAGKRYRIATRVLDQRGSWEPVIWSVDDI